MARDRDHAQVAAQVRAQGQALLDAWAATEAKAEDLTEAMARAKEGRR